MNLPSIRARKSDKGFTIVELLIVIVVIGILAAIVIVAFNGVQARANTTAAKTAAATVQKKAEAYNSINSSYPTSTANFNANTESELQNSGLSIAAAASVSATNGKTTVVYSTCATGGFRVQYWDFGTSALSSNTDTLYGGGATSACTFTVRT